MEKLSGLVLDPADDHDGAILRSIFPAESDVPELIKQAEYLSPERRTKLPDDLFALILQSDDVSLRKYACADAGNTALSTEYFMKTAHKLPVEAQKVAASNLVKACAWYGIEPPEQLEKVAIGLLTMGVGALAAPGAMRQAKSNLQMAKQSPGIVNPEVTKAPVVPKMR